MWIKRSLIGVAVLLLLSVAWRYRNSEFISGTKLPAAKPAAIQFDNGSVRAPILPASGADGQTPLPMPPVGLRKCVRGGTTTYTDALCPTGTKEQPIKAGAVTVVPGQKPAPAADVPRRTLRDALAPPGDDQNLKEKQIDRVIGR
jgi:hypothetical protein